MKRNLVSWLLVLAMCLALAGPAAAAEAPEEPAGGRNMPFTDVSADAEYAEAVRWAAEAGIAAGTGDGTTFSPDAPCTRAQLATFLWRAAGSPEPTLTEQQFMDVAERSAYYDKAV